MNITEMIKITHAETSAALLAGTDKISESRESIIKDIEYLKSCLNKPNFNRINSTWLRYGHLQRARNLLRASISELDKSLSDIPNNSILEND